MNYRLAIGLLLAVAVLPGPALARRSKSPKTPPPAPAVPQQPVMVVNKAVTDGVYEDAAHARHRWKITEGHTLMWDDSPYLPVGGAFTPHIWAGGLTEGNWVADQKALETLKAHKIMDLYLTAGPVGLTHVPARAVQKIVDFLDANGFRYGLEIADFPKDSLAGYVIKPGTYRDPAPSTGTPSRFAHISGLTDALYVLVSAHDDEIAESGSARIDDDTAIAQINNDGEGNVLLLYPQREFAASTSERHMPDLWQGYDEYRDRLLGFFRPIHFGQGLRFFIDPVADRVGLQGDAANVIPTSAGFHLDFQAWLYKKYNRNIDDLNAEWSIEDRDLPDFETAARCVPLWFENKGVLALYDPIKKTQHVIANTGSKDRFWVDFRAFRDTSMQRYLNSITGILKKSVADIPVVYRWAPNNPLVNGKQDLSGFDGFGVEAYGHGRDLVSADATNAYEQAAELPKTLWLIVSDTQEAATPAEKSAPGYTSKDSLFEDWDGLKSVGARGFYTMALQRLPEETYAPVNMVEQPDQLDWLSAYGSSLDSESWKLSAEDQPAPLLASGATADSGGVQPQTGVRWLATNHPAEIMKLGPHLNAYRMPREAGPLQTFVVWSPGGVVNSTKFKFGKGINPIVTDTAGNLIKTKNKHDEWTIPVGAEPVLIGHIATLPLPVDAAENMVLEAHRLIKFAESRKILLETTKQRLFYAENLIVTNRQDIDVPYHLVSQVVDELTEILRPYAWIEGEAPESNNFDAFVSEPGASNGGYLSLDTDRDPPAASQKEGYHADYKFTVNAADRYTLWFAGSPIESATASPLRFRIDNGVMRDARTDIPPSGTYAGSFVWNNLGDINLDRGEHTITFSVGERRASDNKYVASIDAICFSRVPFQPEGVRRPEIREEAAVPPDTGKKR